MTAKRPKPLQVNLTWAFVALSGLCGTYVLSYAPVVRCIKARQPENDRLLAADGRDLPLYVPVDWHIDETALNEPLLWWADVWGVGSDFLFSNAIRSGVHFCMDYDMR